MAQLSIIVTAYNIEAYIAECLDTIVNQTLRDIEIIVVDDGSKDGTPQIIKDYAARDPRIRTILFEKNTIGGVASAANAGLDVATGDYIGFADGDDVYELTMFEKLYDAAIEHDADLAMCKYLEQHDGTGNRVEPAEARRWIDVFGPTFSELNEDTRARFLRFIPVPWRKIYRRDLIEANKIRFPVGDYFYEDSPFHWFSVVSASSIVLLPEVMCYHRVARPGQTMATADERLFKIFQHHETIYAWLVQRGDEPVYRSELIGWAVSQLEWIANRTPEGLRRRLFDTMVPLLGRYSRADLLKMLDVTGKGAKSRDMVLAIHEKSFAKFEKPLGGKYVRNSLLREGVHRLRHHGLRDTLRTTWTFLRGRLSTLRAGRSQDDGISNTDLLFALRVLQRQLEQMEDRLARIEDTNRR